MSSEAPETPRDEEEARRALSLALGHAFADDSLLTCALTHRSYVNERGGGADNERLEFLGDAVVGLVASRLLYARFADAREGELTLRRTGLVSGATLAEIAREVGIGAAMRLGRGELRSGGRDKPRLIAGALEACIGAVYLDAGLDAARRVVETLLESRIDVGAPGANDFKTRLQELVQGESSVTPRYEVVATTGPEHARSFEVAVRGDGEAELARGTGRSKLEAEQDAARRALVAWEEERRGGEG